LEQAGVRRRPASRPLPSRPPTPVPVLAPSPGAQPWGRRNTVWDRGRQTAAGGPV